MGLNAIIGYANYGFKQMNYSRYQANEILDVQDSTKLFAQLIILDLKEDKAYWEDILQGYYFYRHNKDYGFDRKYLKKEDLIEMKEKYGFDFNHIDKGGDNLLLYVSGMINRARNETFNFSFVQDYILNETTDVYLKNSYDQTLIFDYCSYHSCSVHGEEFFKLIKKHPNFDFHQKDKKGRNMLFECLSHTAPVEVLKFYLEKGLDKTIVDKDGYNLLYFITQYSHRADKVYLSLFSDVFENLENIAKKNKYGSSIFDELLVFLNSKSLDYDSKKKYTFWMNMALKKVAREEYKISEQSKKDLEIFFNQDNDFSSDFHLRDTYLYAKSNFFKTYLEGKLSIKEECNPRKMKI